MKIEKKLILIALVSGLLAATAGYLLISEKEKSVMDSMDPVRVIMAKKFIPAKTRIDKDMLKYVQLPKKYVTSAHVTEFEKIENHITLVPFIKDEPILFNKLTDKNEDLNTAIPTGLRAVSVSVNEEAGVGYMMKPGDFVDVLLSFETMEKKKVFTVTATILQSIKVIAVGSDFTSTSDSQSYNSVTLALTPAEAEMLTFAKEKGRISFALRALGDKSKEKVKLASFNELIAQIRKNEKGDEEIKRDFIMEKIREDDKNVIMKREE